MSYLIGLVILLEIFSLLAVSLNLLVGYAGLLQVAQAAYFGIGAYAAGLASTRLGVGFSGGIIVAGFVAGLSSVLVSVPARRFGGDYFVMVSLAVQACVGTALLNWVSLTGGPFGLAQIPRPFALGLGAEAGGWLAAIFGAIAVTIIFLVSLLQRSPFGRALRAMRDDELAARSIGLSTDRLKSQVFAVSCVVAGVAGAMYASYVTFIDPSSFTLTESILMLTMVVVGGSGNARGPLVGAFVLVLLPEVLRFLRFPDAVAADVRLLIYGVALVVMMRIRPQGLAGQYRYQ